MYIIEMHDDDVDNLRQGTRAGRVGHQLGSIEYDYQVEIHMQDSDVFHGRCDAPMPSTTGS